MNLFLFGLSCSSKYNFDNPEGLAINFFKDLKNADNYEKLSKLKKYFLTKDEYLDWLNKTGAQSKPIRDGYILVDTELSTLYLLAEGHVYTH